MNDTKIKQHSAPITEASDLAATCDTSPAAEAHLVPGILGSPPGLWQTPCEGVSAHQAATLVVEVIQDLAAKGFRILDIKPAHIILRQRRDGRLLTRHGRLVYALVDFELLQRAEDSRHRSGTVSTLSEPRLPRQSQAAGAAPP
ncbi:MAG: hypothetical protein RBS80_00145 [Thermoguttaceae bacterium]|nr:hypothetical protein [Thermoguttaceae bacterium]